MLRLDRNRLTGEIPPEIGQLTKLKELTLHSNSLEGSLPEELLSCRQLETLLLYKNNFSLPRSFTNDHPDEVDTLGRRGSLRVLKDGAKARKLLERIIYNLEDEYDGAILKAGRQAKHGGAVTSLESAASLISYESAEVKKWFDVTVGYEAPKGQLDEGQQDELRRRAADKALYDEEPAKAFHAYELKSQYQEEPAKAHGNRNAADVAAAAAATMMAEASAAFDFDFTQ